MTNISNTEIARRILLNRGNSCPTWQEVDTLAESKEVARIVKLRRLTHDLRERWIKERYAEYSPTLFRFTRMLKCFIVENIPLDLIH